MRAPGDDGWSEYATVHFVIAGLKNVAAEFHCLRNFLTVIETEYDVCFRDVLTWM